MGERVVNVQEAKTNLSKLLREVEAGEEITIARAGKAIARLTRVEEPGRRRWRIFEGQVRADADVFDPIEAPIEWESGVEP